MKITRVVIVFFLVGTTSGFSQQLVYTPKNPNFGGNTFNYQWLQSSAEAQNKLEDPNGDNGDESSLSDFQESVNRQLLSQLSRLAFNDQFEDGLQEGTFTIGSLVLEIYETGEGTVVNILDTNTGEQTQIIVPN